MNDLVLYGSGGLAREIHEMVLDLNDDKPAWNLLGFLDDDPNRVGVEIHDLPVLGGTDWLSGHPSVRVVVAVGGTAAKRRMAQRVEEVSGNVFATLIHPLARIGRRVEVGSGSVVCAGTVVTTDIRIGRHVVLNLNCTVGHDAVLEDYVTVAPTVNVSGNVNVGQGCDLGTGSTIIQGMNIGPWTIVGAGAVVVKDLPANVTAVGSPAKPIKERPDGWHL